MLKNNVIINRKNGGFTTIELMSILVIFSIFVVETIPMFLGFGRMGRTSEAQMAVRKMFDGSVTYFAEDHLTGPYANARVADPQFPTANGTSGPADCVATRTGSNANIAWDEEAIVNFSTHENCWDALQFSIADPTYFRFLYHARNVNNGQDTFVGYVHGDLDNDGLESTFSRRGVGENGEVTGSGGVFVENQLE